MKTLFIIICLFLVVGTVYTFLKTRHNVEKYAFLTTPRITTLPEMQVIEAPFSTSTEGLKEVFNYLFKVYFKIQGVPKLPWKIPPAMARYENKLDVNMPEQDIAKILADIKWHGAAALPLPSKITSLPKVPHEQLSAQLSRWPHKEIAEILHKGPYENETATIRKLHRFLEKTGYRINGFHEEVYLRGPGLPWNTPEKFVTIIRYPVQKITD
jgi:effector-binding domain-containing protein